MESLAEHTVVAADRLGSNLLLVAFEDGTEVTLSASFIYATGIEARRMAQDFKNLQSPLRLE